MAAATTFHFGIQSIVPSSSLSVPKKQSSLISSVGLEMDSEDEDLVDIKFKLYDGSDIGPFRYSSTSTVEILKQRLVSDWPQGKAIVPKAASEIKLITSGQILVNTRTVGQCRSNFGDGGAGLIIMHVVVQPSLTKFKTEKKVDDTPRKIVCRCSIL